MAKKKSAPTKVESIRHKDKRKNIPTEELRDFDDPWDAQNVIGASLPIGATP